MRSPERTTRILQKLQKAWDHNPDLRFNQLIRIILVGCNPGLGGNFFYTEDEDFERGIDNYLLKINNDKDPKS